MSRTEPRGSGMERPVIDTTGLEAGPVEGRWIEESDASLPQILGFLAHEFRNPLASMQGCAQTLVDRGDDLPSHTRAGLADVIVKHAERMDWLVRAAAAFGGVGTRIVDEADLEKVLPEAVSIAGAELDATGAGRRMCDERRLRLAVEAVLLAVDGTASQVAFDPATRVLEVRTSDVAIGTDGRRWKLDLAARLLREEGCALTVHRYDESAAVRVHFGGAGA